MKKLIASILFILGIFLLFFSLSYVFSPASQKVFVSPPVSRPELGEILGDAFSSFIDSSTPPVIGAKSALIFDIDTKTLLYEKDPKTPRPMASLTKIMTAIVALENKREDDRYKVSRTAIVGENSMGLESGEVLSLEELLYGLILPSGNDAAETLAQNYPYGRVEFINEMNKRAQEIGAKNTNFTNPSGLQGDGDQYTTAEDLVRITFYALENFPEFKEVVQTVDITLPATGQHKSYTLTNETNLLTSYPGVKGVKTGYTPEAGLCLVTYIEYEGKRLIGVILGSENRRAEMKSLLDYSLNKAGVKPPKHD